MDGPDKPGHDKKKQNNYTPPMRLKKLIRPLLITTVLLGGGMVAAPPLLTHLLTRELNVHLAPYGLAPVSFTLSDVTFGNLTLADMTLGGGDSIEEAIVSFDIRDLIRGRLTGISLKNPDITLDTTLLAPSENKGRIPALPSLWRLPLENLQIVGGRLSLMGETHNATLTGSASLMTTQSVPPSRILTLKLKSSEKDLSFSGRFEIEETENGIRTLLLDIPQARAEMDPVRISRANGNMKILAIPGGDIRLEGQISAGALKIGALPLESLILKASGGDKGVQISFDAGISGLTESGLHMNFSEEGESIRTTLQLSGFEPRALAEMLAPDIARFLPPQQPYSVSFSRKLRNLGEITELTTPSQLDLFLGGPTPIARAFMTCTSGFACTFTSPRQTLDLAVLRPLLETALSETRLAPSSGLIHIAEGTTLNLTDKTVTGTLQGQNIALNWNDLPLDSIQGTLTFGKGASPLLTNLSGHLMDGTFSLDQIEIAKNSTRPTHLTLSNMNLTALGETAHIDGLEMEGTLNGTLPLSLKGGNISLENGATLTGTQGTLHYTPGSYPAFLQGEDERINIVRQALTNYQFESLSLTAAGDLNGILKARLEAKGRNAPLFGERPIHINLNIEGPLAPSLRSLLPSVSPGTMIPSSTPAKEPPNAPSAP